MKAKMACVIRVLKTSKKDRKRHPSAKFKVTSGKGKKRRTVAWAAKKGHAKKIAKEKRKNC